MRDIAISAAGNLKAQRRFARGGNLPQNLVQSFGSVLVEGDDTDANRVFAGFIFALVGWTQPSNRDCQASR